MTIETIGEREMDRLCWILVSTRNRFYPPDETAEECIEHHDIPENAAKAIEEMDTDEVPTDFEIDVDDTQRVAVGAAKASFQAGHSRGNEEGYHRGMFIAHDEIMETLYYYGINVLDRANRYTHINRQHDMEFRLESEPDFYQSVEGGAENTKWLDDIKIENIDIEDAPYIPKGAESDE